MEKIEINYIIKILKKKKRKKKRREKDSNIKCGIRINNMQDFESLKLKIFFKILVKMSSFLIIERR